MVDQEVPRKKLTPLYVRQIRADLLVIFMVILLTNEFIYFFYYNFDESNKIVGKIFWEG